MRQGLKNAVEDKEFMNNQTMTGYPSIDKPWMKLYAEHAADPTLPECSMTEYVRRCNSGHSDEIAIDYFGKKITYGQLFENVERAAKAFDALGVKPGDAVSVISITTPELIYSVYALNELGAVANMLDPRMPDSTLAALVEKAESKLLLVLDACWDKAKAIRKTVKLKVAVMQLAQSMPLHYKILNKMKNAAAGNSKPCDCMVWNEFLELGKYNHIKAVARNAKDMPALIEYTGGTTGTPKGVVLTNYNINSVSEQYKRTGTELLRQQTWLSISAPFITYVIVTGIHLPMSYGIVCKIVLYDPQKIADEIVKHNYNHVTAIPLVWEKVINSPKTGKCDFSGLIEPISGADKMSAKLETKINDFLSAHGCRYRISQGYGMTEVGSGISVCKTNEYIKTGSVGTPFPCTLVSIFEENTDTELTYGQTGEICISGPSVMQGYYKDPSATADVLKRHSDGRLWMHTGDMGHMDEDGYLFVDGRIKRMIIKFNGAKVFPAEIEKVILKNEAIEKCAVVGMDDPHNAAGHVPVACMVLREGSNPQTVEEELRLACAENIPEYAQPEAYKFFDDFPVTAVGKVDYRALERECAKG